jgi:hypothetical protein
LGFFVFPTLFNNWGAFAPVAGFLWFGLLFFAAITSSLAMGQPIMAFLQQEYGFTRRGSAIALGALLLVLAIPVATFHSKAVSDEFDYWAGTVMLVVFALLETILFAWVFGMERGWAEMNKGAELAIPKIFRFIIKYVTTAFLVAILAAYVFKPSQNWGPYLQGLFTGDKQAATWRPAADSMIGKLLHEDLRATIEDTTAPDQRREFYRDLKTARNVERLLLVGMFGFLAVLVHRAWKRRRAEGRA